MAYLESLPNELLGEILSYLERKCLTRISLVSHQLNVVAEPFLYRALSPYISKLHFLLRVLLSRPILATYVRSLYHDWTESEVILSSADITLLTPVAESLNLDYPLTSKSTQLLLLLHILPRMESLSLSPPSTENLFDTFMDEQAFLSRDTLPLGLQSVRKISIYWCDMESGVNPESFLTLVLLPSIRVVDVRMVEDMEIDGVDLDQWTGVSCVTDLRFGFGDLTAGSLRRILMFPKALARFTYGGEASGGRRGFDAPEVGRALQRHRGTLEYLEVGFTDDVDLDEDEDRWSEVEYEGVIGSLCGWPALVKIKCDLTLLLGKGPEKAVGRLVDVLPIVIREFEIDFDCFWTAEQIVEEVVQMLEMKEACGLHSLQVLRINSRVWKFEERLRAQCAAAGVLVVPDRPGYWL